MFDNEGLLVGNTPYRDEGTVITVWGNDNTTDSKDGLYPHEKLNFKLLRKNGIIAFDDYLWFERSLPHGKDLNRCPKPAIDAFTSIFFNKVNILQQLFEKGSLSHLKGTQQGEPLGCLAGPTHSHRTSVCWLFSSH